MKPPAPGIDQNQLDELAKAWSRLIDCISHDLKSPLLMMRMSIENLEEIMPNLVKGYLRAVEHKLIDSKIDNTLLQMAAEEKLIPGMKENILDILNFLNLLNPYNQKIFSADQAANLSVKACIEEAVRNSSLLLNEGISFLHVDISVDFTIFCPAFFIEHLFAHFLSNAIRHIQQKARGEIFIWTEIEDGNNILHFKDTAVGMSENTRAQVFSRFFTLRDDRIVPGLGYCRLALLQRGGDVLCHTAKGQYTDFVVKFPKINL